jgi:hypothetical protein
MRGQFVFVSKNTVVLCVLAMLVSVPAEAQIDPCSGRVEGPFQHGRPGEQQPPEDPRLDELRRSQQKKANEERQYSLKEDTAELLKLATELKDSVDKTTEKTLSVDVIRKAQQIEKLAKNVREKMKGNQYCDLQAP